MADPVDPVLAAGAVGPVSLSPGVALVAAVPAAGHRGERGPGFHLGPGHPAGPPAAGAESRLTRKAKASVFSASPVAL